MGERGGRYRPLQMDALVMTLTPPPEKLNRIWIGGKGAAAGEQPSRARMHSLVRTLAFLPLFPSCLTTFVIGAIKLSTHCAAPKEGCVQREAGGGCQGILVIMAMLKSSDIEPNE